MLSKIIRSIVSNKELTKCTTNESSVLAVFKINVFREQANYVCSRYSHLVLLVILIRPIIPMQVSETSYLEHIPKVNPVQWRKSTQ